MRKLIIFFIIFNLPKYIFGQISFINKTAISGDSMVLIQGIENQIEIIHPPVKFQLKSKFFTTTLTKNPNTFLIFPNKLGVDTLFLLQKNNVLLAKAFFIVQPAEVKAQWGAITSLTTSVAEIIANKGMVMLIPNCHCAPRATIGFFKIKIYSRGVSEQNNLFLVAGNLLPNEAVIQIKHLIKGDKIVFFDIQTKDFDSQPRRLLPFSLTIK